MKPKNNYDYLEMIFLNTKQYSHSYFSRPTPEFHRQKSLPANPHGIEMDIQLPVFHTTNTVQFTTEISIFPPQNLILIIHIVTFIIHSVICISGVLTCFLSQVFNLNWSALFSVLLEVFISFLRRYIDGQCSYYWNWHQSVFNENGLRTFCKPLCVSSIFHL